ncbi:MAG: hypothetical protein ACR2OH_08985 [Microthrixaceae bacterium]
MAHAIDAPTDPSPSQARPALRKLSATLYANAAFSALTGTVALFGAEGFAGEFGVSQSWIFTALGAGLLLFAAAVAAATTWARRSAEPHRQLANLALEVSVADIGWVVATAVVVPIAGMTAVGNVVAIVAALFVADFAFMQLRHCSRL